MHPARHESVIAPTPWDGIYWIRSRSAHEFPKHWHDTYGFGTMVAGAHRSASGRGPVEAYAGDVIASNPGEIHDGQPLGSPTRSWRMLCIDVPAMLRVFGDRASSGGPMPELTRPVTRDAEARRAVSRLFGRLERWKSQRRPAEDTAACDEALIETCSLLMTTTDAMRRVAPTVPRAVRLVRERLSDENTASPSLDEMAAIAGLSKFQLLRRFERAYGLPPHAWLMRQRAERARTLIRRGMSLASAAAQAGFADQSHMSRLFLRHFGFTPGALRRASAKPPNGSTPASR